MRRDQALNLLAEHRDELAALGVKSLSLFGSVARDEARPNSDVDILVELSQPVGLFRLGAIHRRLEEILGRRVDVVTPGGLKPRYRERILPDLVSVT